MRDVSPESPEARRKRLASAKAHFGTIKEMGRRTRAWTVVKRVAVGVYSDGFIHAGNLAYLALLSIFPFVIVTAAVARLFGQTEESLDAVNGLLETMPRNVAAVIRHPIHDILVARSGSLLWLGALVGLWTTGSFIETIRDIIRRAYGVTFTRPFWEYRLGSVGMIIAAVVLATIAFSAVLVLLNFLATRSAAFFFMPSSQRLASSAAAPRNQPMAEPRPWASAASMMRSLRRPSS